MRKFIVLLMCLVFVLGSTGCYSVESNVDSQQMKETEEIMGEINRQIGMPEIANFYEKKLLKDLYELRDDSSLICYAYTVNLEGRYVYQGKCIGYGLPYAVQYSNPQKFVDNNYDLGDSWGGIILPQAEPNGLFMPDALSATWLIMINEETGEREPMYCEPTIIVRQSKAPRRLCAEWSLPENY